MANVAMQTRTALMGRLNTVIDRVGGEGFNQYDTFQLSARLDRFEANFTALEVANAMVIQQAENEEAIQAFTDEFNALEERCLDAKASIRRRMAELAPPIVPANAGAVGGAGAPPNQVINVQVPFQYQNITPTWGKFDGSPTRWLDFKARFEAGMHGLVGPSNAIKFTYLKDSLTGEPKYLLGDGPLDDQGYLDAWEKLCKKYERKYPLASAYLNKLYRLENLKEDCRATDLQRMSNVAADVQRSLRGLGYPVEHWDFIFVQAIHTRLGPYASKWEDKRGEDDMPTLGKMIEFLDRKADSMQSQRLVARNSSTGAIRKEYAASGSSSSHTGARLSTATAGYPCGCCNAHGHKIYDCPEFLPMTQPERMKMVQLAGLCMLCLKKGHAKRHCLDRTRCPLKECASDNVHNSLICPHKGRFSTMHVNTDFPPSASFTDPMASPPPSSRYRGRDVFKRLGDRNDS